ncbi:MAG: TetR/AcrR family transcriptional regulator [Alphaproteobacteria bacterium]|nr:TetR/AcrR family transcriptional regulator [Alphaproteobacteria bacterium]
MKREDRERLIIQEAAQFFAEVGFEGQTRALAERLGITQPLLYRYFPDKETLIERVFDEVYVQRWRTEWEAVLKDRSLPLRVRLINFYREYLRFVFDYQWVRIFMFAGLKGARNNSVHLALIRERILTPICLELRREALVPDPDRLPILDLEIELAWDLHGSIFCLAMRKWIHDLPVPDDMNAVIEYKVDAFLHGALTAIGKLRATN